VFGDEIGQSISSVKTAWRTACAHAGIEDLHFHDLRREFACRLLESRVELHDVRDFLGHANIATTSRYLRSRTLRLERALAFPPKELKRGPAIIAGPAFAKLLKTLDEPARTMVSLIAATGLRIGELLALRWRVLDLEIGTLAVRESVYEGQFQGPKTQKAIRTIPLGPNAIAALTAHRARVTRTEPGDLVFSNRSGGALRESKLLRNVLQPAAEKAGLGRVTWHQFRHIHSSLLNDLKVPVKIAQEQLGHASVATTLNIYTHVVDASHRKAIEAVERELFPSVPKSEDRLAEAIAVSDTIN
jgi:integrase